MNLSAIIIAAAPISANTVTDYADDKNATYYNTLFLKGIFTINQTKSADFTFCLNFLD